jgi:hypothetical protein
VVLKSITTAPAAWNVALEVTATAGLVLLINARFILKSSFFKLPRENDSGQPVKEAAVG